MLGQPTSQICLRGNMTTSKKKRKCLLACARKGLTLAGANRRLEQECLGTVRQEDWTLWTNYYLEIVKNDPARCAKSLFHFLGLDGIAQKSFWGARDINS